MITKEPINPLKHFSEKQIINSIYKNFNKDIASLIVQNGNLFEVILKTTADYDKVLQYISDFAEKQKEQFEEYKGNFKGDGFSMIYLLQVGNDKKEVIPINSKYITYQVDFLNRKREIYLVQLFGEERLDIYEDYLYHDFLVKYKGKWFIHGNEELAKLLGSKIDEDENFKKLGFSIENYKKYGEE